MASLGLASGLGAAAVLLAALAFRPGLLTELGESLLACLGPLAERWRRLSEGLGLSASHPASVLGRAIFFALLALFLLAPLSLAMALIAAALVAALPILRLEKAWALRGLALERELPWMLDFLILGVQAGHDFEQALDRAAHCRPGPLASEIQALLSSVRMGVPRRRALEDWGDRSRLPAIRSLTSALVQADTMGSSLSPVLRAQADAARVRRLQRAETKAQQASVHMLLPLVLCFFPLTFLILFGPIFLSISL